MNFVSVMVPNIGLQRNRPWPGAVASASMRKPVGLAAWYRGLQVRDRDIRLGLACFLLRSIGRKGGFMIDLDDANAADDSAEELEKAQEEAAEERQENRGYR